jgi:succinate dehydrogenase/fumarate reductase-like Fe-S protein
VNALKPGQGRTIKSAQLRVWRGRDRTAGRYDDFVVPFEDGESVLDGLVRIRMTQDPDLAFQFSCFNANVCKECTILVNGKVEYACTAKLTEGVIQVDPIPDQKLLRDLLVDTRERDQKGASLRQGIWRMSGDKSSHADGDDR